MVRLYRWSWRGWKRWCLCGAGLAILAACSSVETPAAPPAAFDPPPLIRFSTATASPLPTVLQSGLQAPTRLPMPTATALPPTVRPTATATPPASPLPARDLLRGASPTIAIIPSPTGLSLAERHALFEEVWQRIADHYLYPDFRGLNWQAVYDEFAERIVAVPDDRAFYALMEEMVGRLNDQHSRFLPPSAAQREDVRSSGIEAQVGIGVLAVPGKDGAWIQHVFPNGPADEAGLQARDRIVAVDGAFVSSANMIHGIAGSRVRLTIVRPGAETLNVVLTRRPVEGRITPVARRLEGDIGYLAVSTLWVQDMPEQVREALLNVMAEGDLRGLILDLRGNPGGWQPVLVGILGHFVQGDVGNFFNQRDANPLTIAPNGGPYFYDLPVAVLIDHNTASYAEVLAGILQREAGATVIGLPSAGNTETIYAYELSGGARLWVAQEGFRLQDGSSLEEIGVQPDILVNVDWTRFSEAQDPITLRALHMVQQMANQHRLPLAAGGH